MVKQHKPCARSQTYFEYRFAFVGGQRKPAASLSLIAHKQCRPLRACARRQTQRRSARILNTGNWPAAFVRSAQSAYIDSIRMRSAISRRFTTMRILDGKGMRT